MRKYDLEEIDRMRAAVGELAPQDSIEDRLRTYMLNGSGPEELEQYAKLIAEKRLLKARIREAEMLIKQQSCEHSWQESVAINGKVWRECPKCRKSERIEVAKAKA